MTDREKLIALLYSDDCPLLYVFGENMGGLADYLLANGVTFATDNHVGGKWIPVTERLPENSRHVLICRATGRVSIGHIPLYGAGVDVSYWYKDGVAKFHDVVSYRLVGVTHWMPLPEPPMRKGESG